MIFIIFSYFFFWLFNWASSRKYLGGRTSARFSKFWRKNCIYLHIAKGYFIIPIIIAYLWLRRNSHLKFRMWNHKRISLWTFWRDQVHCWTCHWRLSSKVFSMIFSMMLLLRWFWRFFCILDSFLFVMLQEHFYLLIWNFTQTNLLSEFLSTHRLMHEICRFICLFFHILLLLLQLMIHVFFLTRISLLNVFLMKLPDLIVILLLLIQ